jgi:hypothetical protein
MASVGGMLIVTASISIFYLEGQFTKSLRYSQYYYPMMIVGILLIALSLVAFARAFQHSQAKIKK